MFIWFFLCPFSLASEAQGFSAMARPGYASAAGLLHSVDRVAVALVGCWAATGSMELPAQPVLCFPLTRHRAPLICSLGPLRPHCFPSLLYHEKCVLPCLGCMAYDGDAACPQQRTGPQDSAASVVAGRVRVHARVARRLPVAGTLVSHAASMTHVMDPNDANLVQTPNTCRRATDPA
jgi:hypothetical protein